MTNHVGRTGQLPSVREALANFGRLLLLIRPYWSGLARGLSLGLIVGLLGLVTPYFAKLYFDDVYPGRDASLLTALVLATAVLSLASAIMGAIRGYYTQVIAAKLSTAVSLMYFNHVQHLPTRFFDEHRVGEIMSRLADMRTALSTVSRVFQTLIVNGGYLVVVPPFLIALNWHLSLLALVTTPVTVSLTTATSRITRRFMKRTAEAGAELNAIQVETLSHIRALKAMGLEHQIYAKAATQADRALHLQLKSAAATTLITAANAVIRLIGTAVFTWYAWTLILKGELSLGSFMAFSAYLGYLVGPVSQVANLFADFQLSVVTFGRAFEYLDIEPEQETEAAYLPPAAVSLPIRGAIEFDGVDFAYRNEGSLVLANVAVTFPTGTVTAVVGHSGAGKSTLLRLLCRMDAPSRGSVRIDGQLIDQIPLRELRRQLAVVWQETSLLQGTIRDNLTLGATVADDADIADALRTVRLDTLIDELPDGLDTIVAEWGATLSGGQRQRLALARALIRKVPIFLLDEATSQIDAPTEEQILRELLPRVRGCTVIMVTHRISTAAIADRICVMRDGRVVAVGTHESLIRDSREYRELLLASQGDDHKRLRVLGAV